MKTLFCAPFLVVVLGMLTACATQHAAQQYQEQNNPPGPPVSSSGGVAASPLAAPPPPPPPPPPQPGSTVVPSAPPAPGSAANAPSSIVRYIGWDTSNWSQQKFSNGIADMYTRLAVYSEADVGGSGQAGPTDLRSYEKENRGWLARLFESETDTVTALANVEIKAPELKLAVPLFSISHASGRDLGNTWVTNYTQSYVESPMFLIGPQTAIVVHLNTQASTDLKSQAAASVIGAVTQAVQIAAPTSTLLTTLSKPEINNAATAVDTAIGNLFSKELTEDVELGRFADTWHPSDKLTVSGCAPFVRFDSDLSTDERCSSSQAADSDDAKIGRWTFDLRCPQISIFDPRDICTNVTGSELVLSSAEIKTAKQNIADSVNNGTILGFQLSSQVTIAAFAQAQTWYTTFITQSTKDYGQFCANVLTGTSSLPANGLSTFDAALALRAMVNSMSGLVSFESNFKTNTTCIHVLAQAPGVTL